MTTLRLRETALTYLAVGIGSAVGGVARALVSLGSVAAFGPQLPVGTLIANVLGSFIICFYAALSAPGGRVFHGSRLRVFIMAGFCGGFTTFSVFSLETMTFLHNDQIGHAVANVTISLLLWLLAGWAGHRLATRLNRLGGS